MVDRTASKIDQFTANSNNLLKPIKEIRTLEDKKENLKNVIKHPDNKGFFVDLKL